MPAHLPGSGGRDRARRRIPGGAALGRGAIGADGGGGELDTLEVQARRWLDRWVRPAAPSPGHSTELARLAQVGPAVVEAAFVDLVGEPRIPPRAPQARTREDLRWILRFVAASVAVDDPRVVQDFPTWAQGVMVVRGVPPQLLVTGLEALARHLDEDLHVAHDVLAAGRTWVLDRVWEPSVA